MEFFYSVVRPHIRMRSIFLTLAFVITAMSATHATELSERKSILDIVRPKAATLAGQPVRIKVDRLNIDNGWAILFGELVAPSGQSLDWRKAKACHPDLDKSLWAVLHKSGGTWQVEQLDICAPEPPYWSLEQEVGLIWPCGVYAGLQISNTQTLEQRCSISKGQ